MSAGEAVLAAEARRIAAILGQDMTALAALLAEDLSFVHTSGRRDDRAGVLVHFAERVHFLACEQSGTKVRVHGDVAMLTTRACNHVRLSGDGSENRFDAWVSEVWRRDAAGWLLAAYHATRITKE